MINNLFTNNLNLLTITNDIISSCRVQNYNKASRLFKEWTTKVSALATDIASSGAIFNQDGNNTFTNELVLVLGEVLKAQEQEDYILMADMLEVNMVPFIYAIQSVLKENMTEELTFDYYKINMEYLERVAPDLAKLIDDSSKNKKGSASKVSNKSYAIENTESGYPTLKIETDSQSFYLEGNINPYRDAITLFDSHYDINAESYIIFGLGLGYLANAASKKNGDAVPITVYEPDLEIIKNAVSNVKFVSFLSKGHKIIYDPNLTKFAEHIQNKSDKDILITHHPSIRNIADESLRDKMEAIFVQDASVRNQMFDMLTNFRSNIKNCNHYVDDLKGKIEGKDVYLVAAGPSLDQSIDLLKNKPVNSVIIAVGRVYRKLHNDGIDVDYVTFLDSAERTYGQYDRLEETGVPLLIASTAYKGFAINTKSDKYLICQNGMSEAEEYAMKNGFNTYNTGGSVATVAFDVALKLGAKRIIALGLDLAYLDNKTHTDGAYANSITDSVGLIKTKGINGSSLYTTKAMDIYRIWFEDRIKQAKKDGVSTEFINASEGGAMIEGMINKPLSDVLNN